MGSLPINLPTHASDASRAHPAGGLRAVAEAAIELAAAGVPSIAGVVVETQGSTYRKRGALILLDATGVRAGALSGGCLESELEEQARNVLARGTARMARFTRPGGISPRSSPIACCVTGTTSRGTWKDAPLARNIWLA